MLLGNYIYALIFAVVLVAPHQSLPFCWNSLGLKKSQLFMGAQLQCTLNAYNFYHPFTRCRQYIDSLQFPTPAAVVRLTVNSNGGYI